MSFTVVCDFIFCTMTRSITFHSCILCLFLSLSLLLHRCTCYISYWNPSCHALNWRWRSEGNFIQVFLNISFQDLCFQNVSLFPGLTVSARISNQDSLTNVVNGRGLYSSSSLYHPICTLLGRRQSLCSRGFQIFWMASVVRWAWAHHFLVCVERHIPFTDVGVSYLSYKIWLSPIINFKRWFPSKLLFWVLVKSLGVVRQPLDPAHAGLLHRKEIEPQFFLECPVSSLYLTLRLGMVRTAFNDFDFKFLQRRCTAPSNSVPWSCCITRGAPCSL